MTTIPDDLPIELSTLDDLHPQIREDWPRLVEHLWDLLVQAHHAPDGVAGVIVPAPKGFDANLYTHDVTRKNLTDVLVNAKLRATPQETVERYTYALAQWELPRADDALRVAVACFGRVWVLDVERPVAFDPALAS